LPNTNVTEDDDTTDDQQTITNTTSQKVDIEINPVDEQRLAEQQTARLVVTTNENVSESHSSTPIYSQIQKNKESIQVESPYSTVKSTPPISQPNTSPTIYSVEEIVQAGIAERPVVSPVKPSKKSASTDGLTKIVNDHNERAQIYQANQKQTENVSYFRVAKSRHGKFETDNQGFINTSTNVFDASNNKQQPTTYKTVPVGSQQQTQGKQAYDLLKKYEKEEEEANDQSQIIDTDYLKNLTIDREKSPTPIQV